MAGYADTRQMIIDTLMGRPAGTEIQPEDHQKFALQITDYVRSVELVAGNATPIGFADADTVPVQPDNGQAVYLSQVGRGTTVVFTNFIDQNGNAISVTSDSNSMTLVNLLWNGKYWTKQETRISFLQNVVDLDTEQTITATKTFSAGISMNKTRIRKVKTPTANDDAANKQYVDNSTIAKPDIFILSSDRTMAEAVNAINKKMLIVTKSSGQYADYGYLFADYAVVWSDGSPIFFFHYIDRQTVYELNFYYSQETDKWEMLEMEYTIPDYKDLVRLSGKQTITGEKTFSAGIDLNGTRILKVGSPVNTDDAANKEYVDDFVATKQDVLTAGKGIVIDDSNTISINFDPDIFKVVSTLPEVPAEGDEKKIHLVPSDYSESGNAYDEYIYVDGSWEKIGYFRPSIDLSEYAKTADIPVEKGVGDNSIVQKGGNNAFGTYSSAFGFSTVSNGNASHTEGISTIALNAYEHAEGRGNVSIKDKTVHTVGIGSLDGRVRKNAEEIHRSGDKYIYGIGGYDGTNSQTEGIKTVQEVVEEVDTKIGELETKTDSLDSRTPVDSGISFMKPWELFPEYSEDVQDVQNYILPGFLQINNQMTNVDGLFNHIRDNNLAGKAAYFTIYGSLGNPSAAIIGNIDTGAVGYKISFSTISRYSDDTSFNNRLIFFEIEIGNLTGDGITIMNSRLMNIRIKDTLSKIDNNTSKIQALESKNTTLESRIAELENIISQITIKEE